MKFTAILRISTVILLTWSLLKRAKIKFYYRVVKEYVLKRIPSSEKNKKKLAFQHIGFLYSAAQPIAIKIYTIIGL